MSQRNEILDLTQSLQDEMRLASILIFHVR